ncbi:unnamed protein product [Symbiodinium microadriaticum]|nr:unnamed protein product [Symbiodinium microadriaticum]
MGRGRGQKWDDSWDTRQPQQGSRGRLWRGAWGASPSVPWRRPAEAPSPIPGYTSRPITSEPTTAMDRIGTDARATLVPRVQQALNHTRKMEVRVKKLVSEKERNIKQWQAWEKDMKNKWIQEKARHARDLDRLDKDISEAVELQEEAREALQSAFLTATQVEAETVEQPSDADWDAVVQEWDEAADLDLQGVLHRALAPRQRAVVTPQRRAVAPMTPPATTSSRRPPQEHVEVEVPPAPVRETPMREDGALRDPYGTPSGAPGLTSPNSLAHGLGAMELSAPPEGSAVPPGSGTGRRDLSQPRVPTSQAPPRPDVKKDSRPLKPHPAPTSGVPLADRLMEKRQGGRQAMQAFGVKPVNLATVPPTRRIEIHNDDEDMEELEEKPPEEVWAMPADAREALTFLQVLLKDAFEGSFDRLVPLVPQTHNSYVQMVAYPSMLDADGSYGVVVAFDLSRVGGDFFVTVVARVLSEADLIRFVRPLTYHHLEVLHFYIGEAEEPCVDAATFTLRHGTVITVLSPGLLTARNFELQDVLQPGVEWAQMQHVPRCLRTPGLCLMSGSLRYRVRQDLHSGRTIPEAIAVVLDCEGRDLTFCTSFCFGNLSVQGEPCDRVIATALLPSPAALPDGMHRRDVWTFCDYRPLGFKPQCHLSHVLRVHIPSLLALDGIVIPPYYDLSVEGGILQGDEVAVQHNTTLVFRAKPMQASSTDDDLLSWPPDDGDDPGGNDKKDNDRRPPDQGEAGDPNASGSFHMPRARETTSRSRSPVATNRAADATSAQEVCLAQPARIPTPPLQACAKPDVPSARPVFTCEAPEDKQPDLASDRYRGTLDRPEDSLPRLEQMLDTTDFRDGPLLPVDADEVLRIRTGLAEDPPGPWVDVPFFIYSPGHAPEVLVLPLHVPCSLQEAMHTVAECRDDDLSRRFPEVVVAEPQPDLTFAVLLAVPAWAYNEAVVLFDCRLINSAPFAVVVFPRINRESLCLAAGLPTDLNVQVYVQGLPWALGAWQIVDLHIGSTVTFSPAGSRAPRQRRLTDMLADADHWDSQVPVPAPPGNHYLALTEGRPAIFTVRAERRSNHRADIAELLQFEEASMTLCASKPQIRDAVYNGFHVNAVVAATEAISRLPVPPARVSPPKWILFLDLRDIFLPIRWILLDQDCTSVQYLLRMYQDRHPDGFVLTITGAPIENGEVTELREPFFRVVNGHVLHFAFVADNASDSEDFGHGNFEEGQESEVLSLADPVIQAEGRVTLEAPAPDNDQVPTAPGDEDGIDVAAGLGSGQGSDNSPGGGSNGSFEAPLPIRVSFALLIPGFAPEAVFLTLEIPAQLDQVIGMLQAKRNPAHAVDFPVITPVSRQPDARWGVCVASAEWAPLNTTVCVDISLGDQRVFAALAPATADKWILLEVAGLPLSDDFDVYCDNTGPLRHNDVVELGLGSVICVVRHGQPKPWAMTLSEMLGTHLPWDDSPPFPADADTDRVCLSCVDGVRVFPLLPHRAHLYREDIASRLHCPSMLLQLVPAQPRQSDTSFYGYPCRTVTAAINRGTFAADLQPVVALVDARRVYRGHCMLRIRGTAGGHRIGQEPGPNIDGPPPFEATDFEPLLTGVRAVDLQNFARQLRGQNSPDIWCFTDGSFYAAKATQPALLGWACLFLQPDTFSLSWAAGRVDPEFFGDRMLPSAFLSECIALMAAQLLSAIEFANVPVHFRSDCQAALSVMLGQAQGQPSTCAQAACNARTFRAQTSGRPDTYVHVAGHAGILGNEIADKLSKKAAKSKRISHGLCRDADVLTLWLQDGAARLPWAGTAFQSLKDDPSMPPLNIPDLGDETEHAGLAASDLLAPFMPSYLKSFVPAENDCNPGNNCEYKLALTIAAFNVLSLLPPKLDGRPATSNEVGLAFQTGAPAILERQLHAHGVHVALLQEARTPEGTLKTGRYTRFCSGGVKGQWGIEVWIQDGAKILTDSQGQTWTLQANRVTVLHTDPRRLLARINCGPVCFLVASLHGPHRVFERLHIQDWWLETHRLIKRFRKREYVLVGGDFNAAVGSQPTPHVGDLDPEPEDCAGEQMQVVAAEGDLFAPNTFAAYHRGDSFTYYQKRSTCVLRTDYILLPTAWQVGSVASYTAPKIHAGHPSQDHVATCVDIDLTFVRPRARVEKGGRKIRASDVRDPANRDNIRDLLRSVPTVPWQTSSHAHAAIVTKHVQDGLQQILPRKASSPKHPYIRPTTWQLQQTLARIRHVLHTRRRVLNRHRMLAAFQVWRQSGGTFEQQYLDNPWVIKATLIQTAQVQHMHAVAKALRAACKSDRDDYIRGLADEVARGPSQQVFAALHRLLSHRRKKPFHLEPLPILKKPDGEVCADHRERLETWRAHFGGLEGGQPTTFQHLADRAHAGEFCPAQGKVAPHPSSTDEVASQATLQLMLRASKVGKAAGLDNLPPELCHFHATDLAPVLYPIFLKIAWRGQEPAGWKGGSTVHFHKRRGKFDDCNSYRAVLLLSTWAKACHKCLRAPLKSHFEASAPDLQLGGRTGGSVVFGAHLVRSVIRRATSQGQASFVIFADIASAFYSVVTHFVAGHQEGLTDQDFSRLTHKLNLTSGELEALREHLQAPDAMSSAGATPWLQSVTERMSQNNWFLLKDDDTPVESMRGTRPGSSFADLVFALLVPKILALRDSLRGFEAKSEAPMYRWDGERTLAPCLDGEEIPVNDVIWADDLAVPRICRHVRDIRAAVAVETSALTDACGEHGLSLAYGQHKTAGLVTVRGTGSRSVKEELYGKRRGKGQVCALREHAHKVQLPLVSGYKHLGVQQAEGGSLAQEVRYRIGQARAAFHEARRKIFCNRQIGIQRKAHMLRTLVLTRLTQGAGSWPDLVGRDRQALETAIWQFYRSMLCIPKSAPQNYTAISVFALTGLPPLQALLRQSRLQYLCQLICSGPDILWAAVRADREYSDRLSSDLVWMYAWLHRTTNLPHPLEGWSSWAQMITNRPGRFKGLLKRACKLEQLKLSFTAALDGLYRVAAAAAGIVEPKRGAQRRFEELCLPCKRAFHDRVSWAAHAARCHGYRSRAHLTAQGTTCLACGRCYASIGRLRRHLISVPACLSQWGAFVPNESPDAEAPSHPLAPPSVADGTFVQHGDSLQKGAELWRLCVPLRDTLEGLRDVDESEVWDCVVSFIEPLCVLRATVTDWKEAHPHSLWHQETGENVLLLMDPEVSADIFPDERKSKRPTQAVLPQEQCGAGRHCYRIFMRFDGSGLLEKAGPKEAPFDWDEEEDGPWTPDEVGANCVARYFQFITESGRHAPFGLWPADSMCKFEPEVPVWHDSFEVSAPEPLSGLIGGAVLHAGAQRFDVKIPSLSMLEPQRPDWAKHCTHVGRVKLPQGEWSFQPS